MNYLDAIIGILLLTGAARGYIKGFVYEVAVLGALFVGVYAAFRFSYLITPWLSKKVGLEKEIVGFVSGFILFLIVVIGLVFLAKLFTGLADIAALGIFNKIAGALFGLIKHTLILSIVLYFFNQLDTKHHFIDVNKKAESVLYYPLLKTGPIILPMIQSLKIEIIEGT